MTIKSNDIKNNHDQVVGCDYSCFKEHGFYAVSMLPSAQIKDLIEKIEHADRTLLLKDSRSVRAGIIDDIFIKRYNRRNFWHSFKRRFQIQRPNICRAGALHLERMGIHTPKVFASVCLTKGLLPAEGYLMTEAYSENYRSLSHMVSMGEEFSIPELTKMLALLHGENCEHGDLSLRNIYKNRDKEYSLIDLDSFKVCFPKRKGLSKSRRRRELARVISSHLRVRRKSGIMLENTVEWIRKYVDAYYQASKIDLSGNALNSRVNYLFNRKRKG